VSKAKAPSSGITAAERRVLEACDTFYTLLPRKPQEAAKLAYEMATAAERYKRQEKK
jgi:hypothetical protein